MYRALKLCNTGFVYVAAHTSVLCSLYFNIVLPWLDVDSQKAHELPLWSASTCMQSWLLLPCVVTADNVLPSQV